MRSDMGEMKDKMSNTMLTLTVFGGWVLGMCLVGMHIMNVVTPTATEQAASAAAGHAASVIMPWWHAMLIMFACAAIPTLIVQYRTRPRFNEDSRSKRGSAPPGGAVGEGSQSAVVDGPALSQGAAA